MRLPRSVRDADVAGKVVLVRADLNVPLEDGEVADDTRIRASLPTLLLLLEAGAREVRVCSHLGRPKTEEDRARYAMAPVERRLRELLPDERLRVLENLAEYVDTMLIGGKMAEQLREHNPLEAPVRLPEDVVAAAEFAADAETRVVAWNEVPEGWLGLDIGPATGELFAEKIRAAKTVFWNGPMGVFEWPRFAEGTNAVARAVAANEAAFTVVGGADSVRALNELGLAERIDWVSTGGGASLELLEGTELPGVAAIPAAG
jgi:3-phosphoglycerate kinase